jgi:hypothetical protein
MKNLPEESLKTMIWSYLDGTLAESDEEQLQSILKVDPVARKFYLRCTAMQSVLGWEHTSREELPVEVKCRAFNFVPSPITPILQWFQKSAAIPLGMAASFLALFSVLGFYFLKQEDQEREKIVLQKVVEDKEPIGWVSHGNGASIIFADADAALEDTGFFYPSENPDQNGMSLVLHFSNLVPETDEG